MCASSCVPNISNEQGAFCQGVDAAALLLPPLLLLLPPLLLLMPPRFFLVAPRKKRVKVKGASSRAGKGKGRARQRLSEHKVREQHLGGKKLQTSSKSSRGPRRGVRLQIPIGKL